MSLKYHELNFLILMLFFIFPCLVASLVHSRVGLVLRGLRKFCYNIQSFSVQQ